MFFGIVKKKWFVALAIGAALVIGCAIVILLGNDYRFSQRTIQIETKGTSLEAVLTLPQEGDPKGLVVMVHGDGAVEASMGGLYSPWFEGAAQAGYATLSWSKPGVGDSSGDWLNQSMSDRATEVSSVIDWAIAQPDIPTDRIVLWGASQAGWVMPKVVADRDDINGVVAVGTAINWLRQGRYNLLAELEDEGANAEEKARRIEQSDEIIAVLKKNPTYERYLATTDEDSPMSADRWAFVVRNFRADASADLAASSKRRIPVLLMVGEHDRNVDVDETEKVYRDVFGSQLTVDHFDSTHSMARPIVEKSSLVGTLVGTFWPRSLLAPGVIDSYTEFLKSIPSR